MRSVLAPLLLALLASGCSDDPAAPAPAPDPGVVDATRGSGEIAPPPPARSEDEVIELVHQAVMAARAAEPIPDATAPSVRELKGDYAANTPLPRHGEVEDIANAAVFLLSDASGWITGQVINIDGGHGLRRGPDLSAMLEPVFGADASAGAAAAIEKRASATTMLRMPGA